MMTAAEDLSYASADRNAERMMHQLHNTSRLAHPPRVEPPMSSRETFDRDQSPPSNTERSTTQDHADVPPPLKDDASKAKEIVSLVSSMRAVHDAGHYLTPEQRRNLRVMSCSGHNAFQRSLYTDPLSSATSMSILSFLIGYVIASLMRPSVHYRGVTHPSSSCNRAVDRMMSYVS